MQAKKKKGKLLKLLVVGRGEMVVTTAWIRSRRIKSFIVVHSQTNSPLALFIAGYHQQKTQEGRGCYELLLLGKILDSDIDFFYQLEVCGI